MSERIGHLSLEARKLTPAGRAELNGNLLASLDEPDARIDAAWAEEAERRLQLVDSGEMPTRDAAGGYGGASPAAAQPVCLLPTCARITI